MLNFQFVAKKNNHKQETHQLLEKFYESFFIDIYNELNIDPYRPLRDAIANVLYKFTIDDHPMAYTGKLVMYIESKLVLEDLHLTNEQREILNQLRQLTKNINLSFVYQSPLTSFDQFVS